MYDTVGENFYWMTYNVFLAVIPLLVAWVLYSTKTQSLRVLLFIIWLMFVPNTVYLFTDILHFIRDITRVGILGGIVLTMQYIALFAAGFLTYILSLYPIEKMLEKRPARKHTRNKKGMGSSVAVVIISINFLIGFGMVIGRVYRLNSWDVIVALEKVILSVHHIFATPGMLMLAILFGLFANFLYFLFKKQTIRYTLKKI